MKIHVAVFLSLMTSFTWAASTPKFSSRYSNLATDCKFDESQRVEGSDTPMRCSTVVDYEVGIYFSATRECLSLIRKGPPLDKYETGMPGICDKGVSKRKLEWRMANGTPFAIIIRQKEWKQNQDGITEEQVGEKLLVKGLAGFQPLDDAVDAMKDPKANESARKKADDFYLNSTRQ